MIDITVAIDKLEKIGLEAVKAELTERGIGSDAIEKLQPILELTGDNERKLSVLRDVIGSSVVGLEGISEMETIFGYVNRLGVELPIELDFSLARGSIIIRERFSKSRRSISPSGRSAAADATTT